jgi:hypothetical protein
MMQPLLTGCAPAVAVLKPPACPEAGADVADEFLRLRPAGYTATADYIGRVHVHCDQIDVLRRG